MTATAERELRTYKAEFEDGTIAYVRGVYAAHAWAMARELHPTKGIKSFYLINGSELKPIP
jgi:hypothetical protein